MLPPTPVSFFAGGSKLAVGWVLGQCWPWLLGLLHSRGQGRPASQPRPGLSCGDGSPGDGRRVKGGVTGRKGSPSLHAARAPHVTYSSGKPVAGVLSLASGWGGGNAFPPWGPWKPGSSWGRACSVASAMSDSCNLVDCSPFRLLCPWDSPGKSTGVGCHFLLWVTFPTQGSNLHLLGLLHW